MPQVQDSKPSSRDRLLAAGQELFHRRGYVDVGLQEILARASVPKGSFYHHFKSKEAFGQGVIEAFGREALREMDRYLDTAEPPLDRLRSFFQAQRQFYAENSCHAGCLLGNLGQELADSSELLRRSVQRYFRGFAERIARCLQDAVDVGELPGETDAELMAHVILSTWHGALILMKVHKDLAPLDAFLRFHLPEKH